MRIVRAPKQFSAMGCHAFVAYPDRRRFGCVKCGRPPSHKIHDAPVADRPSDAERRYHRECPDAS